MRCKKLFTHEESHVGTVSLLVSGEQHCIKNFNTAQSNHIFTQSLQLQSYFTQLTELQEQQPRSLLKAIWNFSLTLIEAGIIKHNMPQHTCAATDKCTSKYTHTHTHTNKHTLREGKDRIQCCWRRGDKTCSEWTFQHILLPCSDKMCWRDKM